MPAFLPALMGIAQLSCLVTSVDTPDAGSRVFVDVDASGRSAEISVMNVDGETRVVASDAVFQHLPSQGLLVQTNLAEIDWLSDQWKDSCYAARASTTLSLQETSYASYEGTFHRSLRLDFNPNFKEPCPVPFPLSLPPARVSCVAAIR